MKIVCVSTRALHAGDLLWRELDSRNNKCSPNEHTGDRANQKERQEGLRARFRVEGKEAELWQPDTGAIEPAEYRIEAGLTTVPLHFDPYGSVFIVFRKKLPLGPGACVIPLLRTGDCFGAVVGKFPAELGSATAGQNGSTGFLDEVSG